MLCVDIVSTNMDGILSMPETDFNINILNLDNTLQNFIIVKKHLSFLFLYKGPLIVASNHFS